MELNRVLLATLAFLAASVLAAFITSLLIGFVDDVFSITSELASTVILLLAVSVPVICGAFAAFVVWRHRTSLPAPDSQAPRIEYSRSRSIVVLVLLLAYLLTWMLGVPAVQTSNDQWVVSEYKRVIAKGDSRYISDAYPGAQTLVAFPLFPCVVASFSEYQITGLYGWGGWQVHLWWPGGIRLIGRVTLFVS